MMHEILDILIFGCSVFKIFRPEKIITGRFISNTEHPEKLSRNSSMILRHISAHGKLKRSPIIFSNHNIKFFTYSTT